MWPEHDTESGYSCYSTAHIINPSRLLQIVSVDGDPPMLWMLIKTSHIDTISSFSASFIHSAKTVLMCIDQVDPATSLALVLFMLPR